MVLRHVFWGVLSRHTTLLYLVRDPTVSMSRLKLRSYHMWVVLGVCLGPIKNYEDSNMGICSIKSEFPINEPTPSW